MQFIDESKIYIRSGNGGKGAVSFRREKYVPMGGPDGGDGGRGGSIWAEAVDGLGTLVDFRYQQHFKAHSGKAGSGRNRTGPAADDIIMKVPTGTQIFMEDGVTLLADMDKVGERILLAKGGQGGRGNTWFKSSTNRSPLQFTPGEEGEERWIWLKLKLLSDAGLLGMPNAGKSTFLARTSRAKPKIADYPFTTIKPQLGVVYVDDKEFVLADIPGLIEGAHMGTGLGVRFLKHVERCGVLLHLVDGTADDVVANWRTIRNELSEYSTLLGEKRELLAINKADALLEEELEEKRAALAEASGAKVYAISAVSGEGVEEVVRAMLQAVQQFREEELLRPKTVSQVVAAENDWTSERWMALAQEANPEEFGFTDDDADEDYDDEDYDGEEEGDADSDDSEDNAASR